MANRIAYMPKIVDPKLELQRRLAAAPNQHAEALLVAYDLLEEAHRQGILDALHGAMGAKDTIIAQLTHFAAEPGAVNSMRNLILFAKFIGTIDPEVMSKLVSESSRSVSRKEQQPPSLWQIFKSIRAVEVRSGIALAVSLLGAMGRAVR